MAEEVSVAKADEIPPGSGKVVEVGGKTLAVFNVDGNFYAIDNTCLHRGGPLGEGILEEKVVTCPWHGWEYDVTTGQNTFNPAIKVESYKVSVQDGEIKVQL
jgi:NAD(P)H-dependent nitrite reductase small subunit